MTIEGCVQRILFQNSENGYTVLVLEGVKNDDGQDECVVCGILPDAQTGETLEVTGEMVNHKTYGPQLSVSSYVKKMPTGAVSIEKYLASGAIKGIGAATAKRIVKKFGDDTFRVMEEEPELLEKVKGISMKRARQIGAAVAEKKSLRDAMIFLQQYNISLKLAVKIYNYYNDKLYNIIRTNPYKLADDIDGVGFKTADAIAAAVGITADSPFRMRSAIMYILSVAGVNGHTYMHKEELLNQAENITMAARCDIDKNLMDLRMERRVVAKETPGGDDQIYSAVYYYMELNVAKCLHDLNIAEETNDTVLMEEIGKIEEDEGIVLDELQRRAVASALTHGLTVITGGPGTGKTTAINTIISYLDKNGYTFLLAAPTGRAAKRMSEATGYEASTIHRLLELTGGLDDEKSKVEFARNESNPLEADAVIIDEMSMVDINIMNALLKAIVPGTRLILVGDADQLPSVGPGNVLKDIIDSGCFNVVKLSTIFRQASMSDIIVNAHKINQGQMVYPDINSKDFLFVRRDSAAQITGATITLVKDKLPGYVGAETHEVQVLTPMRKGALGVEQLNAALQQYLNPPAPEKAERNTPNGLFREGDKVMQIKNDYQLEWEIKDSFGQTQYSGVGVFNGDMGVIKSMNLYAEEMTVEYDEHREVVYTFKQLDELELAYAITIHKSQGSEYPAVILPLLTGPHLLMNRNLLYTAVTRARKCVTIVGSVDTFQNMIKNVSESKRCSGLSDRIREICLCQ